MNSNTCLGCGEKVSFLRIFFASRSFPLKCGNCGERYFRRHDISRLLAYLGSSIGLLFLFFIFISKGFFSATNLFFGFLVVLFFAYILELIIFDLSKFGEQEKSLVAKQSKRNIWTVIVIIVAGLIFYILEL
jgi:hypothetical protein